MSIGPQVIKLKPSGDQFTYFLHYMGWNSRWDKWVVESDLMAAGPEALEMQKQLKEKKKKQKVGRRQRQPRACLPCMLPSLGGSVFLRTCVLVCRRARFYFVARFRLLVF